MEPVGVAVLGTGSIGMIHLKVLKQIPEVRVVAIPTRPGRLKELEKTGFFAAKNLDEALQIPVGYCIVATDTGRHVEDCLAAIERGLDVLVEKPLSTDVRQARRLCLARAEVARQVFVGCVLRFSESLNIFRKLLDRIGKMHSVCIECQSYLPEWRPARLYKDSYSARAVEGGVLLDLIHEIDYAGWIFGWPEAVQARICNFGRLSIEADEAAELMWETPDGCLVSVRLDYLSRPARRCIRAGGALGTLEWDGMENTVTLALAGSPAEVAHSPQSRDEMFLEQARAFINATKDMCDPRLVRAEDGAKALAVCDAARRASAHRREEIVEYP